MEDDHELRELATQLVQGLGYSACSASNGAEAMATLERESNIGLLFTDIIMPGGMSGIELAVEARRRWPDLGILMTSGFPGICDRELLWAENTTSFASPLPKRN